MESGRRAVDAHFPSLAAAGYTITSNSSDCYNCVAWVLRDLRHWWEPALQGGFWPRPVDASELEDGDLDEYVRQFAAVGFQECRDGALEAVTEKIAIYADGEDFAHVAYQRPDGAWSSKLGKLNDVRHKSATAVSGPSALEYPGIALYMARPRQPHELADSPTGLLLP